MADSFFPLYSWDVPGPPVLSPPLSHLAPSLDYLSVLQLPCVSTRPLLPAGTMLLSQSAGPPVVSGPNAVMAKPECHVYLLGQ